MTVGGNVPNEYGWNPLLFQHLKLLFALFYWLTTYRLSKLIIFLWQMYMIMYSTQECYFIALKLIHKA